MEVKPSYKQTEVGNIPDDWGVKTLGELSKVIRGASPRPIDSPIWFDNKSTVGWVRISDVTRSNRYLFETTQRLSELGIRNSRYVPKGSLIMSICATVGKPMVTGIDVCIHDGFVVFESPQIDQDLLFYILVGLQNTWASRGQTGSQMNLNTGIINPTKIPFPLTEAEQRAIAGTLSDVDALIGALDSALTKKRDLKQAAMQQLLTGQKRLPGFHGKWEVKTLGELTEIISGGTPKTGEASYWNGPIKWCTPTDITSCSAKYLTETARTISADGLASCSAQLLPVGSLLLCSRATIGEVRIAGCEICTNQGFKSLVCKPGVSNEFLYYKLLTMKSQIIERAIGSTFLEISKKDTVVLRLFIPDSYEQTAIAKVLSDMDTEIYALEQRRDKTRALKQGMMQELLTGRTRLI